MLNSQLKTQPIAPQQSVPEPMQTFNHVGSVGPTQHPHQAQMQHENLMKVLQIQQVSNVTSNLEKKEKGKKLLFLQH